MKTKQLKKEKTIRKCMYCGKSFSGIRYLYNVNYGTKSCRTYEFCKDKCRDNFVDRAIGYYEAQLKATQEAKKDELKRMNWLIEEQKIKIRNVWKRKGCLLSTAYVEILNPIEKLKKEVEER